MKRFDNVLKKYINVIGPKVDQKTANTSFIIFTTALSAATILIASAPLVYVTRKVKTQNIEP